jgi:serine/threonine-protein kinase SRPK3
MLGIDYDTSADLWSFACMIYELITGDFLFEPRKGPTYGKTDDHIAQMMELLGPMPKDYAMAGKQFDHFFEKVGSVYKYRRIKGLRHFPLKRILTDKYRLK